MTTGSLNQPLPDWERRMLGIGPLIGYKIGDQMYAPEDVTLVYREAGKPQAGLPLCVECGHRHADSAPHYSTESNDATTLGDDSGPPSIVNLRTAQAALAVAGVPVHGAPATGLPLVDRPDRALGADILHVPAGKSFPVHCHPGHHLLLCLDGKGTISLAGITYAVEPGDLYLVPGSVPHAVGAAADADHVLMAVGASPHMPVDHPDRMWFTDWAGHRRTEPLFADE